MLDLKVEIASFTRKISTSIQQYQIVELGSPQGSRHLEAIGRINANAVTPEDISARVRGRLVGIDEEKLLVIENGAATRWGWLVHPNLPNGRASVVWPDSPPQEKWIVADRTSTGAKSTPMNSFEQRRKIVTGLSP